MMKAVGSAPGLLSRLPGIKQLASLRKSKGQGMDDVLGDDAAAVQQLMEGGTARPVAAGRADGRAAPGDAAAAAGRRAGPGPAHGLRARAHLHRECSGSRGPQQEAQAGAAGAQEGPRRRSSPALSARRLPLPRHHQPPREPPQRRDRLALLVPAGGWRRPARSGAPSPRPSPGTRPWRRRCAPGPRRRRAAPGGRMSSMRTGRSTTKWRAR